jgi:ABC-type transport system involved in multi-copper enzyme maturation permease subunit
MSATPPPYRSGLPAGRDGFAQLLRAEWTKLRTVRGWAVGMVATTLLIVLFAVLTGLSSPSPDHGRPYVPVDSGGQPVTDTFYFVHQPLAGNGSITVSVTALTDMIPAGQGTRLGTAPWAKAGLIVKENTRQGSAYAAVLVTSSHGVRMQYDYTHDLAGLLGGVTTTSPRWLRLTRAGDTITGYDSADGTHWSEVGSAHLGELPSTVQTELFVACPPYVQGGGTAPTVATATFAHVGLRGLWPQGRWSGDQVGAESASFSGYPPSTSGGFTRSGGSFTVTGAGDIAPAVRKAVVGGVIGDLLAGTFAALVAVTVVGTLFITTEYRRGLIRATLAASSRRGRVLAAKAIVIGAATFVAGLVGAAVGVPLGERFARAKGFYLFPATSLTELRVVTGTAAMLAVAAILALAVGTILRRSTAAVAAVVAAIVLPYLLISTPFLPAAVSEWLARVTPAAAFAVQQTLRAYPQVSSIYTPANGYYPLAPWSGFAVLCVYAVLALGLAAILLRRRDA